MTSIDRSVRHVLENLHMFGFGSAEAAMLQCIKELLENSLDSIKESLPSALSRGDIQISIKGHETEKNFIILDVDDNGCGMLQPSKLIEIFSSTKTGSSRSESQSVGRFGVGLSACLLYSLTRTGQPARIVTKRFHKEKSAVADFMLGPDGRPNISQEISVIIPKFHSGTKVRLCLPLLDSNLSSVDTDDDEALESLQRGFPFKAGYAANNWIHNRSINYFEKFVGFQQHIKPLTTMEYRQRLLSKIEHGLNLDQICTTEMISVFHEIDDASDLEVTASAVLILRKLPDKVNTNLFHVDKDCKNEELIDVSSEFEGSQQSDLGSNKCLISKKDTVEIQHEDHKGIPIQLWRYVNGGPLLDYDDSYTCSLSSTIQSFNWMAYGHTLKCAEVDVNRSQKPVLHTPSWLLMQKRNINEIYLFKTLSSDTSDSPIPVSDQSNLDSIKEADIKKSKRNKSPTTANGNCGDDFYNSDEEGFVKDTKKRKNKAGIRKSTTSRQKDDNMSTSNYHDYSIKIPKYNTSASASGSIIWRVEPCQLIILFDVRTSNVPYANLSKTIVSKSKHFQSALQKALQHCIKQLQKQEEREELGIFQSMKSFKEKMTISKDIPTVAKAMSQIMRFTQSSIKRKRGQKVQDVLPIDAESRMVNSSNQIQEKITAVFDRIKFGIRKIRGKHGDSEEDEEVDGQEYEDSDKNDNEDSDEK